MLEILKKKKQLKPYSFSFILCVVFKTKIYIQSVHRDTSKERNDYHWVQFPTWKACSFCLPMIRVPISPFVDTALFLFQVARHPTGPRNSFYDVSSVKLTKVVRISFVSEEVEAQTSAARQVEKDLETKQSKQCF